jgi:GrpB-like predicted nucleotidyltransferase (UPF0157 family)
LYWEEAKCIQETLGDMVVIEHFGSTAVPGLDAKPVIDILIGIPNDLPPTEAHIHALTCLGYECLGEDQRRPGCWSFRKRGRRQWFNLSILPFEAQ